RADVRRGGRDGVYRTAAHVPAERADGGDLGRGCPPVDGHLQFVVAVPQAVGAGGVQGNGESRIGEHFGNANVRDRSRTEGGVGVGRFDKRGVLHGIIGASVGRIDLDAAAVAWPDVVPDEAAGGLFVAVVLAAAVDRADGEGIETDTKELRDLQVAVEVGP